MKEKYTKPSDFKIDPNKTKDSKCECIRKEQISQQCLDNGICPTLNIISVHKGFKITENGKLRKEFRGIEMIRKFFEKMKKKKN